MTKLYPPGTKVLREGKVLVVLELDKARTASVYDSFLHPKDMIVYSVDSGLKKPLAITHAVLDDLRIAYLEWKLAELESNL